MSRNHLTLIVLLVIGTQLFAHAAGWIFLIREKTEFPWFLQQFMMRQATCISEDDGDALIWNRNLFWHYKSYMSYERIIEGFTNPIDAMKTNCQLRKQDKCTKKWIGISKDWQFSSSMVKPMGPVFDNRWEAFKEYYSRNNQFFSVDEINFWNTLVFSVRTMKGAHFFFCLDSFEPNKICFLVSIGNKDNEQSSIAQCKDETLQLCKILCVKQTKDILSPKQWRTFILKLSQSKREIQVYSKNQLVMYASIQQEINTNVTGLRAKLDTDGFFRFHQYDYLYTEKPDNVLISPRLQDTPIEICIEMTVGLCNDCTMTFILVDQNDHEYSIKTIHGSDVTTVAEVPAWRRVQIKTRLPVEFLNPVRLMIRTGYARGEQGLWAVAMFRKCSTTDNVRKSTIKLATDFVNSNYVWPPTTCQKLSYDKDTLIDVSLNINDTLPINNPLCPVGKLGSECNVPCPGPSCKYISTCDENGCRCAQGYKDVDCNHSCNPGTYGHNCKSFCGQCKDKKVCNHVTGYCDGKCAEGVKFYIEPRCDIGFDPPMKPIIDRLNYTYAEIKVPINPEYHTVKTKIGINVSRNIATYREIENSIQEVEVKLSLIPGTTYQVQIVAYLTTYNYAVYGSVTNFTTPCVAKREIEAKSRETSVVLSMSSQHEYSCSSNWYTVTLVDNYTTFLGKLSNTSEKLEYTFEHLSAYTQYRLLVKHEQEIYYNEIVVTLQDAPTEVQNLRTKILYEDTVEISWNPPAKANGILTGYIVITNRTVLRGCQCYNKRSPTWHNERILDRNASSLILTGLHPYSKYSVQVIAKTIKSGPSYQVQFETPARKIPTSIVSDLTINNLIISWKPPESCSTITGPTEKVAIVVHGVSENVASFKCKKQTTYNSVNISYNGLHGAEQYTVRAYIIRNYHDPLDDTPYQNLTFKTNATAPPAVTNFEIVEVNTEKNTVIVRWGQPPPPTNGKIIFYRIRLTLNSKEINSTVFVNATERCDLWPDLHCATMSCVISKSMEIQICANNKGVSSCGQLSRLSIQGNWDSWYPEAPRNVFADSRNFGKVFLNWTHPWKTYNSITKFYIHIKRLSTNLTSEWITLNSSIVVDHPIFNYERVYNRTLDLLPSSVYTIFVAAITTKNVLGYVNSTEVKTKLSVGFKDNLEPKPYDIDTTIGIGIPDIVNSTRDSFTYVLVKSREPCKPKSLLPESLERYITIDSYEAVWLAAKFPSHEYARKTFVIGDNKTYGGELNCDLRPQVFYKVIIIAESNDGNIVDEPIIMESLPISIGEVPIPFNKSWLIIIPFLAIVIAIIYLYLYRPKTITFFQRRDEVPRNVKLTEINDANLSNKPPNVKKPLPPLCSQSSKSTSPEISPVINQRRSHLGVSLESEYSSMVKVQHFEDYVREAIATGLLDKQYEMFPRGQTKPWTYGEQAQNKAKNRYKNLLAYDETRVVLETLPDDPYSDYINANYIQGFNKERAYIATQGPKQNTVNDFWRMTWQEKVLVICMVANVMENGKTKCEQYWPDIGKKRQFGDFLVENVKHNVFADYTFRTFHVTYKEETRKIEHLHYTSWPDHGIPLFTHGIVAFLKKLLATSPGTGPIVTHCSAGVGRTGTIILCHICLHRAAAEGVVDVLAETKKIRNQRANMVDNKQQYLMAHLVIAECLLALPTHIPCNDTLPERIREMKRQLEIQQQRLKAIAWQDEALQPTSVKKPLPFQNWSKTRYPEEATDNYKRIHLTRYPLSDADSDYIAAIYVDGVKLQNQYIAAQLPLPSTLSDFWRMIAELKIKLIVQLQPADSEDPTCCEIVPEDEKFDPTPYLKIRTQDIIDSEHFTTRKLLLIEKSKDTKTKQQVTILSCKSWKPGRHQELPLPEVLISLWQAAERVPRDDGPVVSLCQYYDGVTGCGLYLALSFLLERMAVERECDVCLAIRAVRRSNREFVQTIEQFAFLYDAAVTYMEYFEMYSNFS